MVSNLLRKSKENQKKTMKKLNYSFIIAIDFNETSIAYTHIGSDYFPGLLLSKFP